MQVLVLLVQCFHRWGGLPIKLIDAFLRFPVRFANQANPPEFRAQRMLHVFYSLYNVER